MRAKIVVAWWRRLIVTMRDLSPERDARPAKGAGLGLGQVHRRVGSEKLPTRRDKCSGSWKADRMGGENC